MRLGISGSRYSYLSYLEFRMILSKILTEELKDVDTIISGGALGVDSFAKKYATEFNLNYIEHSPEWNKHGRSAGIKRNALIVKDCDQLIAFWNGRSPGTKNAIDQAKKANKHYKTIVINSI